MRTWPSSCLFGLALPFAACTPTDTSPDTSTTDARTDTSGDADASEGGEASADASAADASTTSSGTASTASTSTSGADTTGGDTTTTHATTGTTDATTRDAEAEETHGDGSSGTTTGATDDPSCAWAIHDPDDPPGLLALSGNLGTHDPTILAQDGVFYLHQTGVRVYGKRSTDLRHWEGLPSALPTWPAWIFDAVPGKETASSGREDLWAPDLSFFGGEYHLYYSASTFGSQESCIGQATRASLAEGAWMDRGPVFCSSRGDPYNAIDPNIVIDDDGTPWMAFGSFWNGIVMIELDAEGFALPNSEIHWLASRGGEAIEAPVIVKRCGFYYLFVSFDACCDQRDLAPYNIRVGRSETLLGPYLDRDGVDMMDGGGTLLVAGDDAWWGAGHNAVFFHEGRAYNVYHAYPAQERGAVLRIAELVWDAEGWPISGGP